MIKEETLENIKHGQDEEVRIVNSSVETLDPVVALQNLKEKEASY